MNEKYTVSVRTFLYSISLRFRFRLVKKLRTLLFGFRFRKTDANHLQRIKMELDDLDLQSFFVLYVTWCTQQSSLAEIPQPPPPPHLDSYSGACCCSAKIDDISLWPPAYLQSEVKWELFWFDFITVPVRLSQKVMVPTVPQHGCVPLGVKNYPGQASLASLGPLKMSLEMAHKVILPPKTNYIPQFLKQRDINS